MGTPLHRNFVLVVGAAIRTLRYLLLSVPVTFRPAGHPADLPADLRTRAPAPAAAGLPASASRGGAGAPRRPAAEHLCDKAVPKVVPGTACGFQPGPLAQPLHDAHEVAAGERVTSEEKGTRRTGAGRGVFVASVGFAAMSPAPWSHSKKTQSALARENRW